MTSAESHESVSDDDKAADAPGWALPSADPPLTELQREVVALVAEAQRQLGKEEKWRKSSRWNLLGGLFSVVSMLASNLESLLASIAEGRATDAEREAKFLATATEPRPAAAAQPHALAGGPPTRDEIYEAEMHPWPHHGMAETIEHNRGLRSDPDDSKPQCDPPDTAIEP